MKKLILALGCLLLGATNGLWSNQYTVKFIELILQAKPAELAEAKKLEDAATFYVAAGYEHDWTTTHIDTDNQTPTDRELVEGTMKFAELENAKRVVLYRRDIDQPRSSEVIFGYDRVITDGLPTKFQAIKADLFMTYPKEQQPAVPELLLGNLNTQEGDRTRLDSAKQNALQIATKKWTPAKKTEEPKKAEPTKTEEPKPEKTATGKSEAINQLAQELYAISTVK